MKIVICGNLMFAKKMMEIKESLESSGHTILLPIEMGNVTYSKKDPAQGIANIITHDLIREHYRKIVSSDAILVVNMTKNGFENYVGGNTFLEIGFAHVNHKKIFLLNPIPKNLNYYEEIGGMQPVILDGNLSKIL